MAPGAYQGITSEQIPVVSLHNDNGVARIIAGQFGETEGPARTFTPVNLWDLRLARDAELTLTLPAGHTSMLVVLNGHVTVASDHAVGEAEMLLLSREGESVQLRADGDATLLVLTGEPIDEPIVGHGPFVMNSDEEIRTAIDDFNSGRFAQKAD